MIRHRVIKYNIINNRYYKFTILQCSNICQTETKFVSSLLNIFWEVIVLIRIPIDDYKLHIYCIELTSFFDTSKKRHRIFTMLIQRKELITLLKPYYWVNILLTCSYVFCKKTDIFCQFLFSPTEGTCELDAVSNFFVEQPTKDYDF